MGDLQQALALLEACTRGDGLAVEALLAPPSANNPNFHDQNGWTPLMRAVLSGSSGIVARLLMHAVPASCRAVNKFGKTALHYACAQGSVDIVRLLLQHGADVTKCDKGRRTPADEASDAGHADVVEAMLEACASMVLPEAASPPELQAVTSESLILRWRRVPPGTAAPGTGYRLQYKKSRSSSWTNLKTGVTDTLVEVSGLLPATAYVTRVAATNCFGRGPFSAPSEVFTTQDAPLDARPSTTYSPVRRRGKDTTTMRAPVLGEHMPPLPRRASDIASPPGRRTSAEGGMYWGHQQGGSAASPLSVLTALSLPAAADVGAASPRLSPTHSRLSSTRSRLPAMQATGGSSPKATRSDGSLSPLGPQGRGSPKPTRPSATNELLVLQAKLDESQARAAGLKASLDAAQSQSTAAEASLARLRGDTAALRGLSMEQLDSLVADLSASLDRVKAAKASLEADRRLCVVCQDAPKCMLVMPCRHLCMCSACSGRLLEQRRAVCPICRTPVAEVLNVYD